MAKSTLQKTRSTKKTIVKVPVIPDKDAKQRKKPAYKSFRLHKAIKHPAPPLPSWWVFVKKAFALMAATKRQQFVFFFVYGVLMLVFVRGFAGTLNITEINDTLTSMFDDDIATLASGITAFGMLFSGSANDTTDATQVYQSVVFVVSSLALIWLYRQQQAGNKVTTKMAFYRGMYPLIPFLLVGAVVSLQLLPAIIGNFLFSTVTQSGLIVNGVEQIGWIALLGATVTLSLYLMSSSLMAVYIVTLPEMTPLVALREAKLLVAHRRLAIIRRLFALLLFILVVFAVVVLPLIYFAPTIAEWIFFFLSIVVIPFSHAYLFSLYRELL